MKRILPAVCLLTIALTRPSVAAVPVYGNRIIYARTGATAFNLPNGSSWASPTLSINDDRALAIDVNFVADTGQPGVFYGTYDGSSANGEIVFDATDLITGDPQINAAGEAIFAVGIDDDPFIYDPSSGVSSAINYPIGISGSSNLVLTDTNQLGGRLDVGFSGDVIGIFGRQSAGLPPLQIYAADSGVDASSAYSFIYTPDTSSSGGPIGGPLGTPRIATKVSLVAGFDFEEIRIFDADGTSRLVATETENDPMAPFSELVTNSVGISNNGRYVAFQAEDLGGVSGIYRFDSNSGNIALIGAEGSGQVGTIDIFGPEVNDSGLVVFRGDDDVGRSSVFSGNGGKLVRVAGEGDRIMTDLGLRQLGRRDMDFSQSGAPQVNSRGDVAFMFQYFDPDDPGSVADGSLAILAQAFRDGSLGDGSFDCPDIDVLIETIANGDYEEALDLNIDGVLDLADRDVWLAQAGAANNASGNPYLLGDANLDGTVDGSDFIIWNENRFSPTAAWCSADFNADGVTDGNDFIIWNGNRFQSADAAAVPEPGATMLTVIMALWLRRSRKSALQNYVPPRC